MESNALANIWFRQITEGRKKFSECPEEFRGTKVKEIVKQLLIDTNNEDLIDENDPQTN